MNKISLPPSQIFEQVQLVQQYLSWVIRQAHYLQCQLNLEWGVLPVINRCRRKKKKKRSK